MNKPTFTARDIKAFDKLVESHTKKATDAMMKGEDVSDMVFSSFLLFQQEIDKALMSAGKKPIIFEAPAFINNEFA